MIPIGTLVLAVTNFLTNLPSGWESAAVDAAAFTAGFLVFVGLVFFGVRQWVLSRMPVHWKALELDEAGVRISEAASEYALGATGGPAEATSTTQAALSWPAIATARRTDTGWVLRTTQRQWVFLPFAAFSPDVVPQLDELVARKVPPTSR